MPRAPAAPSRAPGPSPVLVFPGALTPVVLRFLNTVTGVHAISRRKRHRHREGSSPRQPAVMAEGQRGRGKPPGCPERRASAPGTRGEAVVGRVGLRCTPIGAVSSVLVAVLSDKSLSPRSPPSSPISIARFLRQHSRKSPAGDSGQAGPRRNVRQEPRDRSPFLSQAVTVPTDYGPGFTQRGCQGP